MEIESLGPSLHDINSDTISFGGDGVEGGLIGLSRETRQAGCSRYNWTRAQD